ncbi:MAG: DUF86 domain-containing protein [Candidatus Nealsonbacteria bacterium]|nr:DUF86 domain-containing protein [Candidatus Nealsonbacteria bacterium]
MTFQKAFVLQKIEEILKNLEETKKILKFSDKEILLDFLKYHTAERLLQLIVDLMLDINQHFIRELNLKISDDFQGTFYILGTKGILPKHFAQKIAPVVGLRNRIVHRYETLDKGLFIKSFRKNCVDFAKYIQLINQKLKHVK